MILREERNRALKCLKSPHVIVLDSIVIQESREYGLSFSVGSRNFRLFSRALVWRCRSVLRFLAGRHLKLRDSEVAIIASDRYLLGRHLLPVMIHVNDLLSGTLSLQAILTLYIRVYLCT